MAHEGPEGWMTEAGVQCLAVWEALGPLLPALRLEGGAMSQEGRRGPGSGFALRPSRKEPTPGVSPPESVVLSH